MSVKRAGAKVLCIRRKRMKIEKIKDNDKGVTLVVIIITVILLMILLRGKQKYQIILAGVTIDFIVDDKVIDETQNLTNQIDKQSEEHQSLSNMVRNLYEK